VLFSLLMTSLALSGCANNTRQAAKGIEIPKDIRREFVRSTPLPPENAGKDDVMLFMGQCVLSEKNKNWAGYRLMKLYDKSNR